MLEVLYNKSMKNNCCDNKYPYFDYRTLMDPRRAKQIQPVEGVVFNAVVIPASLGSSEEGQPYAPKNGLFKNAIVQYEADGATFIYTSDGVPVPIVNIVLSVNGHTGTVVLKTSDLENDADFQSGEQVTATVTTAVADEAALRTAADAVLQTAITNEATARASADTTLQNNIDAEVTARSTADTTLQSNIDAEATARANADSTLQSNIDAEALARGNADTTLQGNIDAEILARQGADVNLQGQIDAIVASSDVKDIVGTYAELQAYDTSTLGDRDIIKVLQDENQNNETTYYRWSTTSETFTLIGEEGPYYTKAQTDSLLNAKQNTLSAGANIQISGSTISATDTTYTAGNGLSLTGNAFAIDSTIVATQTDLATKQDTITAGTGITLTGATISADTTVLATKEEAVGTTETYTIAATDWAAVTGASPYTASATVTATYTIGADTLAELYNDDPVAFANYGFAIESINGQVLTIYAIEAPTASTTIKVNYKETA